MFTLATYPLQGKIDVSHMSRRRIASDPKSDRIIRT